MPDKPEKDAVYVSFEALYEPDRGYGFVTEKNRKIQEHLRIPELNSGWECLCEYEEETGSDAGEKKELLPVCFKSDVPRHGNYRIKLSVSGEPGEELLIFAGCRRLFFRGRLPESGRLEYSMNVNVCSIIPRGKRAVYEQRGIDVSIVGRSARMDQMEIRECQCPTIYIAGDSTVTDQSASYPYVPGNSYCGWGQMLTCYLNDQVAVSNHAHSGLTTQSFRTEGHYAVVEQYRKAGDYCFFQFGHNDQKLMELKASGGYRENMLRYIRECRERQCLPVLITPMARNSWKGNGGGYNDLLAEYARVCEEVGSQTGTPVIDLHRRSMELVMEKGLEESRTLFYPGDYTHSNDYGAYRMAGYVAQELVRLLERQEERENGRSWETAAYGFLSECVTEGFGEWKPVQQNDIRQRQELYSTIPGEAELLENLERPKDFLTRAEALDFVIRTARFFPTNVYNDMYEDVVGHEWYAGAVECACQNGIIPAELVEDGKLFPERMVTLEEFLMFAMSAYSSRRSLPEVKVETYVQKCCVKGAQFVACACAAGLIDKDDTEALGQPLTRKKAAEICRKMKL